MAMNWDCFVDESKNGGKLTAIGVLLLETGVLENLHGQLEAAINKRTGKGVKIGEVHWSELGTIEADVAKDWLTYFFQAPFTFFAIVPVGPKESKDQSLMRLILSLESDRRVPGLFQRSRLAAHLDHDGSDPVGMLRRLRLEFKLLRAYKWDSRGSRVLQLSDLLLGIVRQASVESAGNFQSTSKGATLKSCLLAHARSEAARFAGKGKKNGLLELQADGLHWILDEQKS